MVNEYANPHAVVKTTNTGTAKYIYDLTGNITQYTDSDGRVWQYTYDLGDNMISTKLVDTTTNTVISEVQYSYDALGKRKTKTTVGGSTTYYWSDTYETTSNNTSKVHLNFGGTHIATISKTATGSTTEYYHNDPLGTSQIVTNQTGSITSATDTLPYGEQNNQQLNLVAGQGKPRDYYALHERDEETGLVYMQARYYNDSNKRFSSIDPAAYNSPERFLSDPQQLNLYSYARNNPVSYNDPSGENIDDPLDVLEIVAGFIPVGGEVIDSYSAITGKEAFGGEPISQTDRYIAAGSIAAPMVGGRLVSELGQPLGRGLSNAVNTFRAVQSDTIKWANSKSGLTSGLNLIHHYFKHQKELKEFYGVQSAQEMYDLAVGTIKSVDNKSIYEIPGATSSAGKTYYNATNDLVVGTNSNGAVTTVHKATVPSKKSGLQNEVRKIQQSKKNSSKK